MIIKLLRTHLILFAIFYLGYTFLNWFLTIKTSIVKIDESYSNFWIPFIIVYIPTLFVLRPLVKKADLTSKTREFLLWALLPFSISIPTAFSQQYFKDLNYQVINVEYPDDVLNYPTERFFRVNNFRVLHDDFTLYKERHVSGGRSKTLKVNNYYIGPMYGNVINRNARIAYGTKYSTSLNHGLLFRDKQPQKIKEFNLKSEKEFYNEDLYNVAFFERLENSETAEHFAQAWKTNISLNPDTVPIILESKKESFDQLLNRGKKMAIVSTLISLTVIISTLLIQNYLRNY